MDNHWPEALYLMSGIDELNISQPSSALLPEGNCKPMLWAIIALEELLGESTHGPTFDFRVKIF